jgi:hypothetical protein
VADAYHVAAIPALFLIGPDGTLKSVGLKGDAVACTIRPLLNEP